MRASARPVATVAAVLLGLLAWELAGRGLASPVLPPASAVLRAAWSMQGLGEDLAASLSRVLIGYTAAAAAGVGLGGLLALGGTFGAGVLGAVQVLRPIPPIAWVPLAILWCGLGDPSAWFIVFIGAFFPIFTQVAWALAGTPPALLELGESLGASRWLVLTRIRFPAALPGIVAGLRTGLGLAWTSVVAAELVGAQSGLGYRIQMHRLVLETDGVLVGMATIGLCGFLMDGVAGQLERRIVARLA
jgi:ABC-type nitrate/sulfonate/bicarbonate transport system permease component